MGLSARQHRAVEALMQCGTLASAAALAGCGEATLRRWRKDPAFAQAVQEASQEVHQQILLRTLHGASEAAGVLHTVMAAPLTADGNRIRAATVLLQMALTAHHTAQLEQRLTELEALLHATRPPP